ncbi:hypothetical protein C8J56DRAFT_907773 [Mycena floridula]|nr:hypothetical protein C8J56DRAFT_907773 [Mycena floridula]
MYIQPSKKWTACKPSPFKIVFCTGPNSGISEDLPTSVVHGTGCQYLLIQHSNAHPAVHKADSLQTKVTAETFFVWVTAETFFVCIALIGMIGMIVVAQGNGRDPSENITSTWHHRPLFLPPTSQHPPTAAFSTLASTAASYHICQQTDEVTAGPSALEAPAMGTTRNKDLAPYIKKNMTEVRRSRNKVVPEKRKLSEMAARSNLGHMTDLPAAIVNRTVKTVKKDILVNGKALTYNITSALGTPGGPN